MHQPKFYVNEYSYILVWIIKVVTWSWWQRRTTDISVPETTHIYFRDVMFFFWQVSKGRHSVASLIHWSKGDTFSFKKYDGQFPLNLKLLDFSLWLSILTDFLNLSKSLKSHVFLGWLQHWWTCHLSIMLLQMSDTSPIQSAKNGESYCILQYQEYKERFSVKQVLIC